MPLPPVVFTNGVKPRCCNSARISFAAAITVSKSTSGAGSRSKVSRSGISGSPCFASPGMKLQHRDLPHRHHAGFGIDREVRLAFTRDANGFRVRLQSRHDMALKKLLAADAIRRAHDRKRPPRDVRQNARRGDFVVADEIGFGDRARIFCGWPQLLVGIADCDAGDRQALLAGHHCGHRLLRFRLSPPLWLAPPPAAARTRRSSPACLRAIPCSSRAAEFRRRDRAELHFRHKFRARPNGDHARG